MPGATGVGWEFHRDLPSAIAYISSLLYSSRFLILGSFPGKSWWVTAQLLIWGVSLIPKCHLGSQGMQTLYPALSQMSEHKQPKALVCSPKYSAWPYSTSLGGKPSPWANKQTNLASWKQAVMLQLISTFCDHKSAWKENSAGCCFGRY